MTSIPIQKHLAITIFLLFIGLTSSMVRGQEPSSNREHRNDPPGILQEEHTDIWIKGGAHLATLPPAYRGTAREDAGDMWKPDASWPIVAGHTAVVQFPPGNIQWAKDEDLQAAFSDLKRRHIALAIGTGMLTRTTLCRQGTEAYTDPKDLQDILEKIRRNGGDLRYIAMDEPFYYGHIYTGPGACNESAEAIAHRVAQSVAMARSIFPQVKIGDAEVVNASQPVLEELTQWIDAYRAAVGEPLAFLQTDIDWSEMAIHNLVPLSKILQKRNVPLAIIYNADAEANTDARFEQSAIDHFTEIESELGIHPAIASFDSWAAHPAHRLPEGQPGTLTNLALQYLRSRTSLSLTHEGSVVSGRLIDAHGQPIPNAPVVIEAVDVRAAMGLTDRIYADTVPKWANTAIIGIRVNTEGSYVYTDEAGAAVGGIRYREQGTGKQQDVSPVSLSIPGAPASIRTLALSPDKTFAPNLRQFPVTPGVPYTLDVPIAATAGADHGGYVTIVFGDSTGKGTRRNIWFSASRRNMDTVTTDKDGRFQTSLSPAVLAGQAEVRGWFQGNEKLRPALSSIPLLHDREEAKMPALAQYIPDPSPHGNGPQLAWFGPRGEILHLFQQDLPWDTVWGQWRNTADHIQVLGLIEHSVIVMPDDVLLRIVQDMNKKHIAIGLGILPTNRWHEQSPCGGGIEGYTGPDEVNLAIAKLMKAGATLSFITMDEPLYFGRYYTGKNACRSSIQDLARRVAIIIRIFKAAFPNAVVEDIEPFPAVSNQPNWQAEYATWVKAFREATGISFSGLQLDFNWGDPHLNTGPAYNIPDAAAIAALAKSTAAVARSNGLQVGMIYNGTGGPNTDEQWMKQARMHIDAVEASGIHPEQVIFGSWDKSPSRSLPETDPNALSSLVGYYFQRY